jgi:hypothetical protein
MIKTFHLGSARVNSTVSASGCLIDQSHKLGAPRAQFVPHHQHFPGSSPSRTQSGGKYGATAAKEVGVGNPAEATTVARKIFPGTMLPFPAPA